MSPVEWIERSTARAGIRLLLREVATDGDEPRGDIWAPNLAITMD
jgi:hypothetical protein